MQKTIAKLASKDGAEEQVTIYDQKTKNGHTTYFVETQAGIKCTAIFNIFVNRYFADDVHGVINE